MLPEAPGSNPEEPLPFPPAFAAEQRKESPVRFGESRPVAPAWASPCMKCSRSDGEALAGHRQASVKAGPAPFPRPEVGVKGKRFAGGPGAGLVGGLARRPPWPSFRETRRSLGPRGHGALCGRWSQSHRDPTSDLVLLWPLRGWTGRAGRGMAERGRCPARTQQALTECLATFPSGRPVVKGLQS